MKVLLAITLSAMNKAYQPYASDFAQSDAALRRAQAAFSYHQYETALAEYALALADHPHIGKPFAGQTITREVSKNTEALFIKMKDGEVDPFLVASYAVLAAQHSSAQDEKIAAAKLALFALDEAAVRDPRKLNDHAQLVGYARDIFLALPSDTIDGLMAKSQALKHWTREIAAVHADDTQYGGDNAMIVAVDSLIKAAIRHEDKFIGVASCTAQAHFTQTRGRDTKRTASLS